MTTDQLLGRIKARLAELYGQRLQGLVLYGSEARGESASDSDIDILVLLTGPVDYWKEVKSIIGALYPLVMEVDRPIDARPVDVAVYEAQEFPLYQHARQEGIVA